MQDEIELFRAAIHDAGLQPPDVIEPDGRIHRFASNGGRADDAGWYVFHGDEVPGGAFGDWRSGLSSKWRAGAVESLSSEERGALLDRQASAVRDRMQDESRRNAEAREKAERFWQGARVAEDDFPYLVRKGIGSHGLRSGNGKLVVPVRNRDGLQSLQFIDEDGSKKFLAGGKVSGCFFLIGEPRDVLCVAEGYATAASIYESTGRAVAVAFNAGNLKPVALALRDEMPGIRLILCADDDSETSGNPGLNRAQEAAEAAAGLLVVPDFGDTRPVGATDFNDLRCHAGSAAIREIIERAAISDGRDVEGKADWPMPKPIVGDLKPVPEFDAETLLPKVLRTWVMDEAERMPCPPDFVAVAALVALGSIVGARCAIRPKSRDSWLIVPNLWGGIVGDPSAKKSPAWGAALKPLDRLIGEARDAHGEALAEYETDKIVFDAKQDAIEGRIKQAAKQPSKGDPAAIARELRAHKEDSPTEPTPRRYKTNDTTVEKLGELLRENPAGLLVLRDELVGLIATWEREGREGDRAFFLEGWNGNQSFDTDRIGRGHIAIPNLCMSIFGGIQPDKLTVYLEQATHALANDGMLQRFQLLVYPDSMPWEWRDRAPDKAARDAAFEVFEGLADFDPAAWGAISADEFTKFSHFYFEEAAQNVFVEWSTELHCERMPREEEPIIQQHLAKFDKLFPALALVFHLVDCAATGKRGHVGKEAALRAAAWCEFLEAHARRCYGLLKDDGLRSAQALAGKLERKALKDGFTVRDLRRNQWRHLTNDTAIQSALDWLEDEGWLRSESTGGTGPGSGRRTVRYAINPSIRRKSGGGRK